MIRIRTGASWRHDPRLRSALRRAAGRARASAARAAVDALALEVDGIDLAAGRAEGPLLPSLEALLRAIARVVAGAPHATVAFPDGEIEVLIRRRGGSALITVVAVSSPSHILARDVEVDVEELAAAALEASAAFCRELDELVPHATSGAARPLRAAARQLRRTATAQPRPIRPTAEQPLHPPPATGRMACTLELHDEEGLVGAYEGGRPDLGSLMAPGVVTLRAADGADLFALRGIPFLALRDLGAAADRIVGAVRRGDGELVMALGRQGGGSPAALRLDLSRGTLTASGRPPSPCPPLELARAFAEAAAQLGRALRARNPRQAENAYVVELEASAVDRLAQIEELAEGDRAEAVAPVVRQPAAARTPQRALGPGRLRRLSFRRVWSVDVGAPAGHGLFALGSTLLVAGAAQVAALARGSGELLWRAEGCDHAAAVSGALLLARGSNLVAVRPRTGRTLWARALPGAPPSGAVALWRGPYVLSEPGAATALDPGSGRTLWRFEPPGATRVLVAPFGGLTVAGADTGLLYGIDAAGRLTWRLRAPGPILRPAAAVGRSCLVAALVDPGAALLWVDVATGGRLGEARLDFVPSGPAAAWGRRIVVAGAIGGDPAVTAFGGSGAPAWTVAPPLLAGAPSLAAASGLVVVRDARGALVALGPDGGVRWSRSARSDPAAPGSAPPAVARGTVISPAGDGLVALDVRTGEIVGAIPGTSPLRLSVDSALGVAAMDADGLAAGWRLATHLSVL